MYYFPMDTEHEYLKPRRNTKTQCMMTLDPKDHK
uniref:Uncharacterized protein n=2 Tax=Lepeophtheirus salmonis TaxID=72036 RepID=A0A0K2VHG6_LEPSM